MSDCRSRLMTPPRTESLGKLFGALAKAQGEIQGASKDKANPFYHSKYADLASVWEACRAALSCNGLCIIQVVRDVEGGIEVETVLGHESGEYISDILRLPAINYVKDQKTGEIIERFDAQTIGSATTYARRYALASFVGVAPEDDDGNKAIEGAGLLREKALASLQKAAAKGTEALQTAWTGLTPTARKACERDLPALKESAKGVTNAPA